MFGGYNRDEGKRLSALDCVAFYCILPISVWAFWFGAFGCNNTQIDDLWIRGLYDPDSGSMIPAVTGLGSTCLQISNSTVRRKRVSYREPHVCGVRVGVPRVSSLVIKSGESHALQRSISHDSWKLLLQRFTAIVFVPTCSHVFVFVKRQNVTCEDTQIRCCDGDGLVVRNSSMINIDAGRYDG